MAGRRLCRRLVGLHPAVALEAAPYLRSMPPTCYRRTLASIPWALRPRINLYVHASMSPGDGMHACLLTWTHGVVLVVQASWRTANERHSRPSSQEEEGRPAPAGGAGEHNGNTSPAGSSASTAGNFTWERPRHVDESAAGRVLESGVANHMFVPSGNIKGLRIKRGSTDSSSDDSWGSNEDAGDFLQEADTMSDVEEQVPEAEKKREELNTFTETNSLWSQLRMLKVVFDRGTVPALRCLHVTTNRTHM